MASVKEVEHEVQYCLLPEMPYITRRIWFAKIELLPPEVLRTHGRIPTATPTLNGASGHRRRIYSCHPTKCSQKNGLF